MVQMLITAREMRNKRKQEAPPNGHSKMNMKTACGSNELQAVSSVNIQLRGFVQGFGNILAILLTLADTLGEEIFNLSVDGAEIIFRPGGNLVIKLG